MSRPRVPPVAAALIAAATMWAVSQRLPHLDVDIPARIHVAILLAAVGAGVALAGVVALRAAGTTVNPYRAERASALVRTGVYRRTRNPMYLGLVLALLGWAAWLSNVAAVFLLPVLVAYLTRFQIAPEERALRATFGAEFEAYARSVRRWL